MKRIALLLVIVLFMVGCEKGDPTPTVVPTDGPTPTVTDTLEPTPTQEDSPTPTPDFSWLDKSCVGPDDGYEVTANACMSGRLSDQQYGNTQEKPFFFDVVFGDVRDKPILGTHFWYDDEVFWIDVTFKYGQYGYSTPITNPGMACHKVIIDAHSTINLVPPVDIAKEANAATNFSVDVIAITGGEEYTIGQVPIANPWDDGHGNTRFSFAGDRHWEIPFYFVEEHGEVEIIVVFKSIWNLGNHGSTFGFNKIGVFRQDNFNECAGVVGL